MHEDCSCRSEVLDINSQVNLFYTTLSRCGIGWGMFGDGLAIRRARYRLRWLAILRKDSPGEQFGRFECPS